MAHPVLPLRQQCRLRLLLPRAGLRGEADARRLVCLRPVHARAMEPKGPLHVHHPHRTPPLHRRRGRLGLHTIRRAQAPLQQLVG